MKGAKGEQGRDIAKILSILRITLQIQGKSDWLNLKTFKTFLSSFSFSLTQQNVRYNPSVFISIEIVCIVAFENKAFPMNFGAKKVS